ncbi:muscarinic acetylcholine receptor M5-like [Lytechinus variegatus]|uniref:muscarinic acetylcholine receptor M5-like n=1 Tax=Lytechinus variegatus TaxID=7654 RepID=UPI001BB1D56C|nr:muscarinic acetylcholine receptor M5-like [Lytechinus variegatus]
MDINENSTLPNDDGYPHDGNYGPPAHPAAWLATVPLTTSVISAVTTIGNIMVIVAYCRDNRIRSSAANLLILNLAITDLAVGALLWPINIAWLIKDFWPFGETLCKVWLVTDYTMSSMSVLTLVLISWDRYCLLMMGVRYQTVQTKKRIGAIICISWIVESLWYILIVFASSSITGRYDVDYAVECHLESKSSLALTLIQSSIQVYIPFAILIILNLAVYYNIKRRSRGIVGQSPGNELSTRQATIEGSPSVGAGPDGQDRPTLSDSQRTTANASGAFAIKENLKRSTSIHQPYQPKGEVLSKEQTFARHRKAAVVLAILVGCFLICWLPVQVTSIMYAVCGNSCVSWLAKDITDTLVWGNSMINPFIYAATNKHFRRNFRNFLLLDRWPWLWKLRGV